MNATPQAIVTDEQLDLNVLLWEADPLTLQFSYVSPAAERLLGYSLERWLSQPTFWEDLLHPDDRERAVAECRKAIADCRDHMFEYRMVAADGRVLWFRDLIRVICDADGDGAIALRGVMLDITDRKYADQATGERDHYFQTLVEQSLDIVTVLDRRGIILYESPAAERILGHDPSSRIGRNAFDFVHPEDTDDLWRTFENALASGCLGAPIEFRSRHVDGTWRTLEAVGRRVVADDGEPSGIITTRDITERRQLEDQMRRAHKMDALSRLTGSIAHDFNNVLTAIVGHADALKSQVNPREAAEALNDIRHVADMGAQLTRQLLLFSRRSMPSRDTTDAHLALREMQGVLTPLLGPSIAVEIETDARPALVPLAHAMFERLVVNLALNARDAMPWGGRFRIATSRTAAVNGNHPSEDENLVLEVSDNGIGMSLHVRSRIFEPFFTTKAPGKGIGLGLSTVYGVVQDAGGQIDVDSELGRGTRFVITLPVGQR